MQPADTDETFESIPWEALLSDPAEKRRKVMGLAAGFVAVLAIAATLSRTLWPLDVVPDVNPTVVAPAMTRQTIVPETTAPLSEADLMAIPPEALERSSSALAAWFLSEYFTLETPGVRGTLTEMLPAGLTLPAPNSAVRSFVDSVEIMEVNRIGVDRLEVVAVVRRLVDADGTGYRRVPAQAMKVMIALTEEGPAVAALPTPIELSFGRVAVTEVTPPESVASAAIEKAAAFGTVEVFGGHRQGTGWAVTVMIIDSSAIAWPFEVFVEE